MKFIHFSGKIGNVIYLDDDRFSDTVRNWGMDGECYYDNDTTASERDYWKYMYETVKCNYELSHDIIDEAADQIILDSETTEKYSVEQLCGFFEKYVNGERIDDFDIKE